MKQAAFVLEINISTESRYLYAKPVFSMTCYHASFVALETMRYWFVFPKVHMQKCKHAITYTKWAVTTAITCWHKSGYIEHKTNHNSCVITLEHS